MTTSEHSSNRSRRLTTVVLLSILVLLLMLLLIAQSGFNLKPFVTPDTAAETLLLYALSTLNFLAFVTLLFVLSRNVLKLVRERRAGRIGSKFKTRLVGYAIGLSLLPVLLLFFFAFGLLNRSIDRWFGEPARQIVADARAFEESYFKKEESESVSIARAVARALSLGSRSDFNSPDLPRRIKQEVDEYNLAVARLVGPNGRVTVTNGDVAVDPGIEDTLSEAEQRKLSTGESFTGRDEGEVPTAIYVIAAVPISESPRDPRLLIIARELPSELTQRAANINEQHENFHVLLGKVQRIKATYVLLLGAVTLLLIFAATWLALHTARGITVPIESLAEATDRVARGDFAHPVSVAAEDELATLVQSFNQMASMLAENRERIEAAAEELSRTNLALDDRRRYIETVLESLSTGVISTDEEAGIATINRSALWILGIKERPPLGTPLERMLEGEQGHELTALCRRARRTETSHAELEITRPDGSRISTATTAIALRSSEGEHEGWVIVIEDLTELIQAERAAAWGEVARRMAHEIKNPLTPIQLSAERILRNFERDPVGSRDPRFERILREGTSTIVREVAALQRMVEEFSRFARLPEARPIDASLNDVVRNALGLYRERLDGIRIDCRLAADLPALKLDTEQMNQVLVNLIENAVEALGTNPNHSGNGTHSSDNGSSDRLIVIESQFHGDNDSVRLIVADTGHGINPRDRDKLFLPKFSTRDRGTGLGLAIVGHIVTEHNGRIWVEDNQPRGARFVIELPASRAV